MVAVVGAQRTACPTFQFMESFSLLDWTRIGAMNLRKARHTPEQRAADVSSAEASFFCRQDPGSTLRFMESPHGSATAHWDPEPRRIPLTRPSGTLSPSGGEGWGEGVRFMESFNLQHWTHIENHEPGSLHKVLEYAGRADRAQRRRSFSLKRGA